VDNVFECWFSWFVLNLGSIMMVFESLVSLLSWLIKNLWVGYAMLCFCCDGWFWWFGCLNMFVD